MIELTPKGMTMREIIETHLGDYISGSCETEYSCDHGECDECCTSVIREGSDDMKAACEDCSRMCRGLYRELSSRGVDVDELRY